MAAKKQKIEHIDRNEVLNLQGCADSQHATECLCTNIKQEPQEIENGCETTSLPYTVTAIKKENVPLSLDGAEATLTKARLQANVNVKQETGEGDNLFKCFLCLRDFGTLDQLQGHKCLHDIKVKDKPHQCSTCGKAFRYQNLLRLHENVHSTETHTCPICQKTFPYVTYLIEHKKTHKFLTQEHKCSQCHKVYPCEYRLDIHMKIKHNEDKVCHLCDERFGSICDYKNHLSNIHNITSPGNICPSCGSYFPSRTIKRHVRKCRQAVKQSNKQTRQKSK